MKASCFYFALHLTIYELPTDKAYMVSQFFSSTFTISIAGHCVGFGDSVLHCSHKKICRNSLSTRVTIWWPPDRLHDIADAFIQSIKEWFEINGHEGQFYSFSQPNCKRKNVQLRPWATRQNIPRKPIWKHCFEFDLTANPHSYVEISYSQGVRSLVWWFWHWKGFVQYFKFLVICLVKRRPHQSLQQVQ